MNVTCPIVQHVSELSFDFFSNCQGFVLIPQNVLRLLVSCVIKIKVKGREWCMICTINKVGSAHIFVWYKKWPNLGSATATVIWPVFADKHWNPIRLMHINIIVRSLSILLPSIVETKYKPVVENYCIEILSVLCHVHHKLQTDKMADWLNLFGVARSYPCK